MRITVTHLKGAREGERESFESPIIKIGREPSSDIRLGIYDTRASRLHAEISFDGANFTLRDLGSTNGTFVNGQRIRAIRLRSRDVIEFGVGGPQLQIEFETSPLKTLALSDNHTAAPAVSARLSGDLPEVTIAPPTIVSAAPIIIREREFVVKTRFALFLSLPGLMLIIASIVLLASGNLLMTLPSGLTGLLLASLGWSIARKNITISARGIEQQSTFRSRRIAWEKIQALRAERSRTRVLTHQIFIVDAGKKKISFAPSGYRDGWELANLISQRTGMKWE